MVAQVWQILKITMIKIIKFVEIIEAHAKKTSSHEGNPGADARVIELGFEVDSWVNSRSFIFGSMD